MAVADLAVLGCRKRRRVVVEYELEAGGQGVAEGDALLAGLQLDDLLDQDRRAVAAGHGADGGGEAGAGDVVEIARAVAGAAAELGERERGLVGLRPVPRAQREQPVGDPGGGRICQYIYAILHGYHAGTYRLNLIRSSYLRRAALAPTLRRAAVWRPAVG